MPLILSLEGQGQVLIDKLVYTDPGLVRLSWARHFPPTMPLSNQKSEIVINELMQSIHL